LEESPQTGRRSDTRASGQARQRPRPMSAYTTLRAGAVNTPSKIRMQGDVQTPDTRPKKTRPTSAVAKSQRREDGKVGQGRRILNLLSFTPTE
jgi:hypothetical protein